MQFSTIYAEVAVHFDPQYNSSGRIKQWVNAAYHDVIGRAWWSWTMRTAALNAVQNQAAYSLVGNTAIPDVRRIIDVAWRGATPSPLMYVPVATFDEITNAVPNITAAAPALYAILGGAPEASSSAVVAGGARSLGLWPAPNAAATGAIQVRYYRGAASVEMTADTDVPMLPAKDHDVLIQLAIMRGYTLTDGQVFQGIESTQMVEARIQRMVQEDGAALVTSQDTLTEKEGA